MSTPAAVPTPLRVAVVGAGPAGFYVIQALLKGDPHVRVDLFDRLPAPYGLVRYGVAPDHLKIKNVTKVYARLASDPRVRFFGNVEIGTDLTVEDLEQHYHQVAYCVGAQSDRRLGIPGEDLAGSHPATEFVAWYNGHPDHRDRVFDLSHERAVVVGVGNVAIDVARILVLSQDELLRSDAASYAVEALAESRVREVLLVGRRGPAQAAFTNSEIEEIGALEEADAVTLPGEVALDDLSRAWLEAHPDRQTAKKVELLQTYARPIPHPKPRRIVVRFLLSPVELQGGEAGHVSRARFVKNELYASDDGSLRPRATETFEEHGAGLVFRSVGYRGSPLSGVPFRDDWGTIPHDGGRVLQEADGAVQQGFYAAGWIKRGPSGVIGTNRPDGLETAHAMLDDARAGRMLHPVATGPGAIPALLGDRGVRYVTFEEWERLDAAEVAHGQAKGRPRDKFTSRDDMLGFLAS